MTARVLKGSPGRTIGEVLRNSTAHVTNTSYAGMVMANCVEPHEVIVDGAGWAFHLPAGKFTALSGLGVVAQMIVTPHLDHLDGDRIAKLSAEVRAEVTRRGFLQLDHKPDDAVRKSLVTHDEDRSSLHEHGPVHVELRWKVALRMSSPLAKYAHLKSDGLLLSVWIVDLRLH